MHDVAKQVIHLLFVLQRGNADAEDFIYIAGDIDSYCHRLVLLYSEALFFR